MNICLPKLASDAFKTALKSGRLDPAKLAQMTSEQRRATFSKVVGETNAKNVNSLFESKLLLKNQKQGMITWAKTMAGMKPEVLRDILTKVGKMTEILSPTDMKMFLSDIAEKRLGMHVTAKEASEIASLANKVEQTKGGDRMAYGRARVAFSNYVGDLKLQETKLKLADFKSDPLKSTGQAISNVGGQTKSITASLDNSAIFNQGWKVLWTNPLIWQKNALKTFGDMVDTVGGKNVIDEINADIVSRPTYDLMQKAKLAVGVTEEAFPSALPEKVPVFGRVYKASQDAYTGFVHRTRADVFDKVVQIAKDTGVELTKKELESIGQMVNSLTGRGHLGVLEPVANVANNLLFSPRFLKSNIDVFTQPITGGKGSNFVRKQSAKNLVKIVAGTATVLAIADALLPGSVEWDSKSADFGAIKVGNTRFKIGGGIPGIVTLASRMIQGETKSSTTGKITKLDGEKFGSQTRQDVFFNFFTNKFAPLPALVRDWAKGKNFNGEKPTLANSALNLITPFPVKTYQELANDPDSANDLVAMIASAFGINIANY